VAETAGLGITPGTSGEVPRAGEVTAPGAAGEATPATFGEVATPGGGTGGVMAVAGVWPGAAGGGGGG
jgi:hypothetical protein